MSGPQPEDSDGWWLLTVGVAILLALLVICFGAWLMFAS